MSPKSFVIDRPMDDLHEAFVPTNTSELSSGTVADIPMDTVRAWVTRQYAPDAEASLDDEELPRLWHTSVPTATLLHDAYLFGSEPDVDFERDPDTHIFGHVYDPEAKQFIRQHIRDLPDELRTQIAFELLDSILARTEDLSSSYDELLDRAEALRFLALESLKGVSLNPVSAERSPAHLEGVYNQLNEAKKICRRVAADVRRLLAHTSDTDQRLQLDTLAARCTEVSAEIEPWHANLRNLTERTNAQLQRKKRLLGMRAAQEAIRADLSMGAAPLPTSDQAPPRVRPLKDF
ncbi:MAG TPA: hypothetical protein VL362_01800 [Patescibacteria group bacterium]|jgi:hypothetical protein|nr:hypothetical protein [Patescibacteria group bacterium]